MPKSTSAFSPGWTSMRQTPSGAAPRKRRNKVFDRLVGAGEPDLGREGLVDTLGAQAGLKLASMSDE